MRLFICFLLLLVQTFAFAQESSPHTVRYFSKNFQTQEKQTTANKRVYFLEGNGIRFEDYTAGKINRKGNVNGTTSLDEADSYIWYSKTWQLGLESNRRHFFPDLKGVFTTYNAKGNLEEEIYATGYTIRIGQIWSRDNLPLLEKGSGSNSTWNLDKSEEMYFLYKDSVMVAGYALRQEQNDTIYIYAERMAMPKNGMPHFTSHLATQVQYPGLAAILGKEGLVYVSFVVDEKGKLVEFRPLNRPGYSFDKKAIEKMAQYPAWEPAMVNGKPVKMRYSIPFRFQMEK